MVKKYLSKIYMGIIFIFLYAPIIVLGVFSFNESKSRGNWTGFSLKWYIELFHDHDIRMAFYYTITIAIITAIVSTILGTIAAIGINAMKGRQQALILNVNYLPVVNPDIVTGISLMILYISFNMDFGFMTMLLSHIVFSTPYVILSILPKLKQLDVHMTEAAMDLGATPMYALRKVILPEIKPGIITGFLMAFTLSIDDFIISYFTKGEGVTNLSIVIYSMARRGVRPTINALSTIMLIVVLLLMILINKRTNGHDKPKKIYRSEV
ncbi:MAG TPA: ABC transporter permease [Sedimentibacter sp.]|jgi:spermidine/putrescine transport system permease protein|nr:ABC transporter permease [Tissierellia bacterium]HOA19917.1 ABC transporter permease [Sedimentibacter sp.]HOG62997.1 ABC transporter permease [Sedimentibacter sp.]HOT21914.1 ABC transporter permease [Sedimentibacter sp.]HPB79320.1 ABC transporter permease [Sedimentibacter sp.]